MTQMSTGGQWVNSCLERKGPGRWLDPGYHLYRENCCTHVSPFILYIPSSVAQRDNACSSLIVFYTNGPPLRPSRTGPLHDCPWLRVNKPWPPTLPLSAVWFPIGQPVVSILLCLCFHQHGAQTTLSFPPRASTNTLRPLYCP